MKLQDLLKSITTQAVTGPVTRDITGIAYDSRKVAPGTMFIALRGEKADGHDFIEQAIEKGAVAVLCEEVRELPNATVVTVPDSRLAMAAISAAFYHYPGRHLKLTAVTGTNGKTTFTFLLKYLCDRAFQRSGLIGTVWYDLGGPQIPATRTTPESLDLQEMLYRIRSAGCRAAVMEASSHALVLNRLRGLEFDVAVFTNLTQDHLDFHKTMEAYFEAKSLLWAGLSSQKKKARGIVNIDDRYGDRLWSKFRDTVPMITYGLGVKAEFRASNMRIDFHGTTFQLDAVGRSFLVRLPLIGRFNVYNALAALAAAHALGINLREAVSHLAEAPGVPGRLEAVPGKRPYRVFVDYAHTPDALINVLKTLRELGPNRLITVFGCGGNRDKAKRPLMAAAVEEYSDIAIITSDNPRKEDPTEIIREIQAGFRNPGYSAIVDRREAIHHAIQIAQPRDIVLIAGKGHENYQEFANGTVPFDDVNVAREAMDANANRRDD